MSFKNFECMTDEEVIKFIKSKMIEHGISQRKLADYVGITEVSMSRYLNYKRTMPFSVMSKSLAMFDYAFACYDLLKHCSSYMRGKT